MGDATSPHGLAREQLESACAIADEAGISLDVFARALLSQTLEIWQRSRSAEDLASELRFVADHLEDEEFHFMRP